MTSLFAAIINNKADLFKQFPCHAVPSLFVPIIKIADLCKPFSTPVFPLLTASIINDIADLHKPFIMPAFPSLSAAVKNDIADLFMISPIQASLLWSAAIIIRYLIHVSLCIHLQCHHCLPL